MGSYVWNDNVSFGSKVMYGFTIMLLQHILSFLATWPTEVSLSQKENYPRVVCHQKRCMPSLATLHHAFVI